MNLLLLLLLLLSLLSSSLHVSGYPNPPIGITYSHRAASAHLHNPQRVVSTLRSLGIRRVRLLSPTPDVIRAFSYSGISLLLSVSNFFIPQFASNRSHAVRWLSNHVVPFYPRVSIALISVGDNIPVSSPHLINFLLPAIRNVYLALHELEIHKILVSTTHSFDLIKNPFPPSAAEFQEALYGSVLKQILEFLSHTNSTFLINVYPYHLYRVDPEIPIGYALFQDQPFDFRDDLQTALRYWNLFDVMVDAAIHSMEALGHVGIPVVVTETGWPSHGGANEPDATEFYAEMYNGGLLKYLKSGLGTPKRRVGVAGAYIFELFDEEMKQGPESERHWGILYPNMTMKYTIDFSGSVRVRSSEVGAGVMGLSLLFVFLLLQGKL